MWLSPSFYQFQPREADLCHGKTGDSSETFKDDTGNWAKHLGHVNTWVLFPLQSSPEKVWEMEKHPQRCLLKKH